MEEFAYAAGSIMAAMLGTSIKSQKKHNARKLQKNTEVPPETRSDLANASHI